MCISTNKGFYLYHTSNFKMINELKDKQIEKLGKIRLCKVLSDSQILCFSGSTSYDLISDSQVCFYNFDQKKLMSVLNFKCKVVDLTISVEALYVLVNPESRAMDDLNKSGTLKIITRNRFKLLVFDLKTLKLIYRVNNHLGTKIRYASMLYFSCSVICNQVDDSRIEVFKCKLFYMIIYSFN